MKKDLLKEKVEEGLNEIRPFLESDGGNIELISIVKNVVKVKLLGNCVS
jgi:Fe-S cluster biogenesis protein NfuA